MIFFYVAYYIISFYNCLLDTTALAAESKETPVATASPAGRKSKAQIGLDSIATKEGRDELAEAISEWSDETLHKSFYLFLFSFFLLLFLLQLFLSKNKTHLEHENSVSISFSPFV